MYKQALNNTLKYASQLQKMGRMTKWGIAFGKQTTKTTSNALNIKQIKLQTHPLEIFSKLQKKYQTTYLLESIEGPQKLTKYSFIGFDPKITIQSKNGKTTTENKKTGEKTSKETSDPLQVIQSLLKSDEVANSEFRFVGGAVGYISYDAVRYWEKLPENHHPDLGFPDLEMGIFDDGFIFDHLQKQTFYYYRQENRLPEVEELIKYSMTDSSLIIYRNKRSITTAKRTACQKLKS